ncbi:ABC transporter substrate-binding protein, partial [Staphylococcus aureus]
MTRKLKTLILIFVATIALSGCANDDGIYSDKGQVFRKILSADLTSLDTSLITDEISSEVTAQTFEGLYTLGKGDKPVLGVAKAFPEKSKDGKTLKVKLRSDAKWSNGDKVTAQDFVYAWRKTVDPKTGSEFAYIMGDIKNASDISTGKKPVE